jgi:predicted esterase
VSALRACFGARDDDRRVSLEALDAFTVPRDPARRAALLREAIAPPSRPAASRVTERWGDPPTEGFVATPGGYDSSRLYPTVLSLSAYCADPHQSLTSFALPREEWDEVQKGPAAAKPTPGVPWDDGFVLAPSMELVEEDPATFDRARARLLDVLARAHRAYGVDPDRTVVAGFSLGAALAYDVASRHPDRFAAMADVSGGSTFHPTPHSNLRTLDVYIMHGDQDAMVDVSVSHQIDERLTALHVPHTLDILKGGEHAWPEARPDGERLGTWLRAKTRNAWPAELDLIFAASTEAYRIYWLELPPRPKNKRVTATVKDNVITLGAIEGCPKIVLHLGEPLVDLDREVVVKLGAKELFRGKLERRFRTLVEDLETDGWDTTRAAPARLELALGP